MSTRIIRMSTGKILCVFALIHVTGVPKRMATCFVEIFSLLIDFGDLDFVFHFSTKWRVYSSKDILK